MNDEDYNRLSKHGKEVYRNTYKFEREANCEEASIAHSLAMMAAETAEAKKK